jgi:hypothetical protein
MSYCPGKIGRSSAPRVLRGKALLDGVISHPKVQTASYHSPQIPIKRLIQTSKATSATQLVEIEDDGQQVKPNHNEPSLSPPGTAHIESAGVCLTSQGCSEVTSPLEPEPIRVP